MGGGSRARRQAAVDFRLPAELHALCWVRELGVNASLLGCLPCREDAQAALDLYIQHIHFERRSVQG